MKSSRETRLLAWAAMLALGACMLTFISGWAASWCYTAASPMLRPWGLMLERLRPLHDSAAIAWVFLGGTAVVSFFLHHEFGPPTRSANRRTIGYLILWFLAGIGIVGTLVSGKFTGREYLGYHPAFSAMILAGWLLFAWNYFERVGFRLKGRPVHILMWSVAIPLFMITYVEGHLYLFLDAIGNRPVRDIAVQWKSNGTLVGAFNHLVYGSLIWVSCRLTGSEAYARSRIAFALFTVGLLNTFANYGHHTFHLPQSPWIHWISFVVSMLEVIILAKVAADVLKNLRSARPTTEWPTSMALVRSATGWTFVMLFVSVAISVPPLNAVIHGTHVVVAHSMGSMIGINTTILLGVMAFLVPGVVGDPALGRRSAATVHLYNAALAVFWLALLVRGAVAGWARQLGPTAPDVSWMIQIFPAMFVASGTLLAVAALWIIAPWMRALLSRSRSG